MGKIYNKEGNKMGVAEICKEICGIINQEESAEVARQINKYDSILDKPNEKLAHAFVDTYRKVSSTDERGQRLRKLMAGVINKYQKSVTEPRAEDNAEYQKLLDIIVGEQEIGG